MNIVELTDLVGRKQWIDLADIVTMHRENIDTPYAFTQMLLTNHHVVRVQERPEAIVERVRK